MLRTISKAYEYVKSIDEETAVNIYTIRQWCKLGLIKYRKAGNKVLIDIDSLMDYINMNNDEEIET